MELLRWPASHDCIENDEGWKGRGRYDDITKLSNELHDLCIIMSTVVQHKFVLCMSIDIRNINRSIIFLISIDIQSTQMSLYVYNVTVHWHTVLISRVHRNPHGRNSLTALADPPVLAIFVISLKGSTRQNQCSSRMPIHAIFPTPFHALRFAQRSLVQHRQGFALRLSGT